MKKSLGNFLISLSFSNLFFIPEWANFFGEQSHQRLFFTPTPFENAYFAIGFTVIAAAFILFVLLLIAEKFQAKKMTTLIYCVLAIALIVPLNFAREATALFNYFPWLSTISHEFFLKVVLPFKYLLGSAFLVGFVLVMKKWGEKISASMRFVGLLFTPIIFVTYSNLIVLYKDGLKLPRKSVVYQSAVKKNLRNKILWLIFDELDYRLVFGDRPHGLKLPELDRLREQSIFASQAYPPSDYTLQSIPSLLTGHRVDVASVNIVNLILKDLQAKNQTKWHELANLFREAKSLGYSTSLVGWYHNYCRIFKDDLDYCRRLPAGRFGYAQDFWGSVKAIVERSLIFDRRLERAFVFNLSTIHQTALRNIESKKYDLTFLHYSVPHKPYLFDSKSKEISSQVSRSPNNYLGNLEVVDSILGDIRRSLEKTAQWENTIIILSSDHSWRQSEEFDGKRDFRVPFLIKMTDLRGVSFSKSMPALITKDLICAILKNEIRDSQSAIKWISTHSTEFPNGTVLIPFKNEENHERSQESHGKNNRT
jgi:hypothetical protein